jgi:thiol-disulfide isomerase/thioredoxin
MSVFAFHFWSPTCAPCVALKPSVEDLKEEFPNVEWVSVNIQDDSEGLAQHYGVKIVPTIAFEARNKEGHILSVEKQTGINISTYYRSIRSALKTIQQS